jgi:hypothetical protein
VPAAAVQEYESDDQGFPLASIFGVTSFEHDAVWAIVSAES